MASHRAQRHYSYIGCGASDSFLQRGEEQFGKQEMANMVCPELDFEAFLCKLWRIRHGAGVEDQDIQAITLRAKLLCSIACGLERR